MDNNSEYHASSYELFIMGTHSAPPPIHQLTFMRPITPSIDHHDSPVHHSCQATGRCTCGECVSCGYVHHSSRCSPTPGGSSPPPPDGGGGGDGDKGNGKGNNDKGDVPCVAEHISDRIAKRCFFSVIALLIIACLGCKGTSSLLVCFRQKTSKSGDCEISEKLSSALGGSSHCKAGAAAGARSTIPPHLEEQYNDFRAAVKSSNCRYKTSNCPGVVNYGGNWAAASIVSTRDTVAVQSSTRCKCKNAANCVCDANSVNTIIEEREYLIPGKCWSFYGTGKVLIKFFYPIIVTGVSLHHPMKSTLPPGYFSSAPKDFELWGYQEVDDKGPFSFGKFEFTEKDAPSKIYEVQNMNFDTFNMVQFNFLTNHGNRNYTAVYKVEVHGLLDQSIADKSLPEK